MRSHVPRPLTVLLASAVAVSAVAGTASGSPPYPQQPTAIGYGGAAATEHPLATQAAIDILDAGGNAVDAAVAASAVQSVVRPFSGGIGGGGYMVIYLNDTDEFVVLDHRSEGASSFDEHSLADPTTGEEYPEDVRVNSGPAFGVPGLVKAWEEAVDEYGSGVPLADLLQPAIDVAENGFVADETFVREVSENAERFCIFPATADLYLSSGCAPPSVGTLITNPDLAATYELIADEGSTVFYEGELAEAIVDTINNPTTVTSPPFDVIAGDLTLADLAGYEVRTEEAVHVTYRGYDVYGAPPTTSGGVTIGQALNVLAGYDFIGVPRAEALHYSIEAARHAFADQQAYLGDPATYAGNLPVAGLLNENYAENVRQRIGETGTQWVVDPGDPWPFDSDPSTPASPLPAPGRRVLATDFSGLADGVAWETDDAFATTQTSGGDSVIEVAGEAGVMQLASDQFSYVRADSLMEPVSDSELLVRFRIDDITADGRLRFWLRADEWNRTTSPTNGYAVEISTSDDTVRIIRTREGNAVHGLETFPHARTTEWQWLRFRVDGDQLRFRIWPDGEPEPRQTWTGMLQDTSVSGAGILLPAAIELTGGTVATGFTIDDIHVTELNPATLDAPFAGASDGATWDSTGLFATQFGNGASNPGVGAEIDIQQETGRIYLDSPQFSYARAESLTPELTDSELLVRFRVADLGDDRRLRFWLRGDEWNTLVSPNYGYGIEIRATTDETVDNVRLLRVRHGNSPWTAWSDRLDLTDGWLWLRFRVNGEGIKARLWADGEPEPLGWMIQRTDTEVTGPGKLMIGAIESTGATGSDGGEFYIDDLTLFDHDVLRADAPEPATAPRMIGGDDGPESTIHLTVSDADGNVVAHTHTLSYIGGNGMVVPGYGFLLNNELSGRVPSNAPVGHPNGPRPNMRPLSTQSPTIVMKDGEPVAALGSPGGGTIITTVLQILVNMLDFGMTLPEAVAAPRLSQRNHSALGQTLIEPAFTATPEYDLLVERGHDFFVTGLSYGIGAVNAVAFLDDGRVQAVSEPERRGGGSAMVQLPESGPACPDGHVSDETIAFGLDDSGVPNSARDDGCTFLDVVYASAPFHHHGELVRAVRNATAQWVADGLMTVRDARRVTLAALRSSTPAS